jgi:hypothetical protein
MKNLKNVNGDNSKHTLLPEDESDPRRAAIWDHNSGTWVPIARALEADWHR